MKRTTPDQMSRGVPVRVRPHSTPAELYVSHAAMDFLEEVMKPEAPDIERSAASLVAEQERSRLILLLRQRLVVYGS